MVLWSCPVLQGKATDSRSCEYPWWTTINHDNKRGIINDDSISYHHGWFIMVYCQTISNFLTNHDTIHFWRNCAGRLLRWMTNLSAASLRASLRCGEWEMVGMGQFTPISPLFSQQDRSDLQMFIPLNYDFIYVSIQFRQDFMDGRYDRKMMMDYCFFRRFRTDPQFWT